MYVRWREPVNLITRAASPMTIDKNDPVVTELKAAGASLVLAMAAAENGDWAAAEQGAIDAQERGAVALREIQIKLRAPPEPGGEVD